MKPVYLDTNALIHLVERREIGLKSFVRRVNDAGRRLVTSEIIIAELLVKPIRSANYELVTTYEAMFSPDEGLIAASLVTRATLRRSAEIRAEFGGHLVDSIHVATAEMLGCEAIISSDERLRLPDGLVRIPIGDLNADDRGLS